MRYSILTVALALLTACSQPTTTTQDIPTNVAAAEVAALKSDIAGVEDNVLREALTRRVDDLDKRVGALEAAPQQVDLDLLNQRVQALEGKSSVSDLAVGSVPLPKATPRPRSTLGNSANDK
ncbi:hypothetical protein HRV97_03040 [Sphingomonas sp. HHU CXW]|uniref:Uncharacterized protein n=1 Tax=Sphingomonas hominis TaxID=2741495 RepID=A0ABX2JHI5_9SPHN|nr:hypothetical protein [Sphingomonas hominis]NTS64136.1 hypothetical protein [Sphingomonas hominis]